MEWMSAAETAAGRFAGWMTETARRARFDGDSFDEKVAVDGMHVLQRYNRSYSDYDRRRYADTFVGRFETDREAIAEWRRMLREGEI